MAGGTTVKQERRDDDREINQMARQIMEQNRQKQGQQPGMVPGQAPASYQMVRPGQPGIQNYFGGQKGSGGQPEAEKRSDDDSRKGRFGWCEFEKNHIPYIFRSPGQEKYTSVRMVERKLLDKFLRILPSELYNNSCYCIKSYYITDVESKLLNEINLKHTDCHFGKEAFTSKDMVVKLSDGKEFYRFLDLCYKKLVLKKSNATDRCGFFRINGESVVPYTMKEGVKYVPLFYFEGETDHLELESDKVDGWDLAYLKFCCKVQGVRDELFADEICRVVALDEIRGHFPAGTTFEDYWPAKGSIEPVNSAQRVSAGNWTQKPAQPAAAPTPSQQQANGTSNAAATNSAGGRQQPSAAINSSAHPHASQASSAAHAAAAASNAAAYDMYNQFMGSQAATAATAAAYQAQQAQQQQQRAAAAQLAQQQQQQAAAAQQYATQYSQILQAQAAAALASQQAAAAAAQQLQQQQRQQQLQQQQQQQQRAAAAAAAQQQDKAFPGKMTQVKEFPYERNSTQAPYKLQKALIDQKIVPCINVRPFVFRDLMMTLPDFVTHFYPELSIEKARNMLQDILKVVLYKGNSGHQEVLRNEKKCNRYDPVPLVLVKDIMNYMPQMKYMFNSMATTGGSAGAPSDPAAKRARVM